MLKAKDIHKHYGQLWVLKGVDLELKSGEIAGQDSAVARKVLVIHKVHTGAAQKPAGGNLKFAGA